MTKIPFNKPCFAGNELKYIKEAVHSGKISGDGLFTRKCAALMEKKFRAKRVFLTPSASAALDMSSLLIGVKPGDEVIVPAFTFTSTVNAFCLFGGIPVFTDIREDTLNIDENLIEEKITKRTKAVYCMHYAGISCEMDVLVRIAKKHKLFLIEDAAQGVNAKYKDKYLGTIGDLGAYSYHETKNYNCGEGGALLVNNKNFTERAEIIREKGTDRAKFFRGEVDKYTWRDIGSSYLLSEILAAYLYAQLEKMDEIKMKRKKICDYYTRTLKKYEELGKIRFPVVPMECAQNYHIFYLLFENTKVRDRVMTGLKKAGILAVYHYLPLHSSPMGRKFGYKSGDFPVTEELSGRLLRLPLYNDLTEKELEKVVKETGKLL